MTKTQITFAETNHLPKVVMVKQSHAFMQIIVLIF